jgi:hypothetical protein
MYYYMRRGYASVFAFMRVASLSCVRDWPALVSGTRWLEVVGHGEGWSSFPKGRLRHGTDRNGTALPPCYAVLCCAA